MDLFNYSRRETSEVNIGDLTKPEWKGKIAYCLPSKSGSAYTQLCTMILGHGGKEDEQES